MIPGGLQGPGHRGARRNTPRPRPGRGRGRRPAPCACRSPTYFRRTSAVLPPDFRRNDALGIAMPLRGVTITTGEGHHSGAGSGRAAGGGSARKQIRRMRQNGSVIRDSPFIGRWLGSHGDVADRKPGRDMRRDGQRPAGGPPPPEQPTDLGDGGWWAALKRTIKEFRIDNLTDWAAALTYYGVLSVFPGLLVLVSLIGLAGDDTIDKLTDNLSEAAPGSVRDVITNAV